MQTYLPLEDFAESAAVLDNRRLDRQRGEVYEIMKTLAGVNQKYANRPVMNMWRGSELVLVRYGVVMCNEFTSRGGKDEVREKIVSFANDALKVGVWKRQVNDGQPWWLGVPGFHASHRSNLLRMDGAFYRRFWPTESDEFPMVWPPYRPRQVPVGA